MAWRAWALIIISTLVLIFIYVYEAADDPQPDSDLYSYEVNGGK